MQTFAHFSWCYSYSTSELAKLTTPEKALKSYSASEASTKLLTKQSFVLVLVRSFVRNFVLVLLLQTFSETCLTFAEQNSENRRAREQKLRKAALTFSEA